jgi:hypothetical protein
MTPARERLLRLALAMPEEGVATIVKSIVWICPGLANANRPALVQEKVELLESLRRVASDPELLGQLSRELEQLKQTPIEPHPCRENVVRLFEGSEGPEAA